MKESDCWGVKTSSDSKKERLFEMNQSKLMSCLETVSAVSLLVSKYLLAIEEVLAVGWPALLATF